MKTARFLRLLSLLGFLLLFAPFYDSCDGNYPFKKIPEDGIIIKKSLSEKVYDVLIDEASFNALEIASTSVNGKSTELVDEMIRVIFEKDWKNLSVFVAIVFDFIVLISCLLMILSWTKKIKTLNKLALVNTILILLTFFYIIFLESSFEHFRQIKWGYYAFIITNILIFYYSKPNKANT